MKNTVSISNERLEFSIDHYNANITINGKTLHMKIEVYSDGSSINSIEGGTNLWNSLSEDEKDAIDDFIDDHYN